MDTVQFIILIVLFVGSVTALILLSPKRHWGYDAPW